MKLIFLIAVTLFSLSSLAQDYKVGAFAMFSQPNYQATGCDIGTAVTIDKAELLGNVVFLEDFLSGQCEIFVAPNARFYQISSVTPDGCGSLIYKGARITNDGVAQLEITDNRTRLCDDVIPALVVVKETSPGFGEAFSYSQDN